MNDERSAASARRWVLPALGVLVVLLLVPLPRPRDSEFLIEELQNLLHVPAFFLITLLLRRLQMDASGCGRSVLGCAFVSTLLGGLSEILQGLTGRTPSAGDFGADLAGVLLACWVLLRGVNDRQVVARRLSLLVGGGMFALAASPLVGGIVIHRSKMRHFPVLIGNGGRDGEWQGREGTRLRVARNFPGGLEVEMKAGDYEGLRYTVPRGLETKGYSGLVIETGNEGDAFELGVRIDVTEGRRKNAAVMVPHGRSLQEVDWRWEAGDSGLRRVVLFTGENQPARKFRLIRMRLVGDAGR